MARKRTRQSRTCHNGKFFGFVVAAAFLVVGITASNPAKALPSFARQTGETCSACHVDFPELTPFGRLFKLKGYTETGGDSNLPPIAMMVQPSFTHTQGSQANSPPAFFKSNNNIAIQQTSLFYGGAIDSNIGLGAFAQVTYDATARRLGWDNTDIRWAHPTTLSNGDDFIYGVTLNNAPSVEDVWNTTPAWSFPFASSDLAPSPAASTLIDSLAQQVAGLGGYVYWNDLVYAELTGYRTLSKRTLTTFGVDSTDTPSINGVAPYWRLAIEPQWGPNSWEFGTFGMTAAEHPQRISVDGTDQLTDVGLDTQYQFLGARDNISVQASWIHEWQDWSASHALGLTNNANDSLDTFKVKTSYFYHKDYGINLSYFNITGTTDTGLYSADPIDGSNNGSPNSAGFIVEADYFPFNHGGPNFWPWLNMRLALQYTAYTKFNGGTTNYDGSGRNASDNNTLYLLAWIMF